VKEKGVGGVKVRESEECGGEEKLAENTKKEKVERRYRWLREEKGGG